jgi:hypothetical protein
VVQASAIVEVLVGRVPRTDRNQCPSVSCQLSKRPLTVYCVENFRDCGGLSRSFRRKLIEAHHAVRGNVATQPQDELFSAVEDQEIRVRHPSGKGASLNLVLPTSQAFNPFLSVHDHGAQVHN